MPELSDLSVCFIAGTLGQGGAERQLFYIARTLKRLGAQIKVLSLTEGEYWEHRLREIGIPVLWAGRSQNKLVRLLRIVTELRRDRPDIVQSQHFYTNLYAAIAARIAGCRDIGALRSDVFSDINKHTLTGEASLKLSRLFAVNSNRAIENASRQGVPCKRLYLLPNVVDISLFELKGTQHSGIVKLLCVGRFTREKRFDRFLSLLKRVREELRIEVKGVIAGDGPLRNELQNQAQEMGLYPNHLEFCGKVRDMASLYKEADMLILTSEFEGTPNVILEAMASGLPVVATAVGGVPEIVENNKTGYLIDPYDESQMSVMIMRLAASPDLRLAFGSEARKLIEINYSMDRLPRYLENLYRIALS